jgi:Protein kinase domain/SET domain
MSRWGPRHSERRSISPYPASSSTSTTTPTAIVVPPELTNDEGDRGFQIIDSIEWADDPDHPYTEDGDELAMKPKADRNDDPCVCTRPMDQCTFTCRDLSCVLFACQEECRSSCPAGDQCGNKRIQRREWKRIEVFDAGPKGRGLRLLEDVSRGDFIVEYVGRAIPKHFLPHLFHKYSNERRLYIMALDNNIYLDARKRGGVARYINHSCEPNCVVERWKVRGNLRASVMATQDIPAGTELSFDYQWERKRGRAPTKCHCGAPACRGTLEVPRSMEEEALERQLSTHWTKPLIQRARNEIINRCVRVWSKETQEYFIADVSAFDETTGKHLLMYRHDLDEVWEDLKIEDWMILDEEARKFIINRKKPKAEADTSGPQSSLLDGVPSSTSLPNVLLQGKKAKNYLFVQTPIKEAMWSKHLIDRCQRSCQVSILPLQCGKPSASPDPNDLEEVEKCSALEQSRDGTIWKLSIAGMDVLKAQNILEKNVAYLEKQLGMVGNISISNGGSVPDLAGVGAGSGTFAGITTEVVLPRSIVDNIMRRLALLRVTCRNVNVTFVPSESKSKQFAKLVVEGSTQADVDSALEVLYKTLTAVCSEYDTPKTPSGVYVDLGFLGGELSSSDFHRLLQYDKTTGTTSTGGSQLSSNVQISQRQDAKEDLSRWSPFFASFESTQRCAIWVQSNADKGRIDSSNLLVSEATPNAPRKIYFGCEPKAVPKLWSLVKQRASEAARGVKYLYLGPDRLYQPMMMRNGGRFFEFVRSVTGASVTVDSMTGDHLRIDGKGSASQVDGGTMIQPVEISEVPTSVSEGERAALAEELIRLQIELYRDHCSRQQGWIFGRDWALARRSVSHNGSTSEEAADGTVRSGTVIPYRGLTFDSKSSSNACLEISDIVAALGLSGSVAAHAAIIFYRFATTLSQPGAADSQLKMREVELACIFIASKSQKKAKWKRLDALLEAAYKSFYPGVMFDASKEEVLVWEDRVVVAEIEVLCTLAYDVFWRGFDWIVSASIEAGQMDHRLAKEALKFVYSGPMLASGADLWLTYGAEYVFAAAAGFLDAPLDGIFSSLSLIPFKVHQAAEIVSASMRNTSFGKIQSTHPVFKEGKKGLSNRLPLIKDICAKSMTAFLPGYKMDRMSEKEQRYRLVGQMNKGQIVFTGVEPEVIRDAILPALDGIVAESNCSIYLQQEEVSGIEQLILEGSWRPLSIASYLLQEVVNGKCQLIPAATVKLVTGQSSVQAKVYPGQLWMTKIETADGWADTIQSKLSTESFWGRKTGGKICVPAKIKESELRQSGLRWWIPPRYGPCPSGTICDMFLVNNCASSKLEALAEMTQAFQGESVEFSMLSSMMGQKAPCNGANDRFVPVSLQRWPTEKVAKREMDGEQKDEKSKAKSKNIKRQWKTGFSAAALQELQTLYRIHGSIKSPQGHPNFLLPIAVGLPKEEEEQDPMLDLTGPEVDLNMKRLDEDIFSLTRSSLENEVAAEKERKRKDMVTGPHLIFHPTPFVLQRFAVRKKGPDGHLEDQLITPAIFASWTHDLLSALLHCHSNDIILRNFIADQIMVDHSGVIKLGCFYRATIQSKEDKRVDILRAAIERKKEAKRKKRDDDEDVLNNIYAPPEVLLGSPKLTKETDIWMLGCLLCHLLLGKPAYTGKDRQTMLLAIYKLTGIPSSDNFKEASKFPYYEKPQKKYAPGVSKALTHMMKDENPDRYSGALDLISRMLALDPKKRITAKIAMQHEFMQSFVEKSAGKEFQEEYARDWISLKKRLMHSSKTEVDERKERERGIKRKAMLLAANQSHMGGDELYDMDDILGDVGKPLKMSKH